MFKVDNLTLYEIVEYDGTAPLEGFTAQYSVQQFDAFITLKRSLGDWALLGIVLQYTCTSRNPFTNGLII